MPRPSEESFRVEPEEAGARLDALLAARLGIPRARARRLVAQGAVSVDGRLAGAGAKGSPIPAGATVEVSAAARAGEERALPEPDASFEVLAEGPGWIALDKPAGTPVHPLAPREGGTLLNALAARRPEVHGVGESGLRSGVVHRLDVQTSGVVLFATSQASWERLREAFSAHRPEKLYRALVLGRLEGEGRVELGLVVSRHRPARVRVVDPRHDARGRGARLGRLRWRALESFDVATLIEVTLETGHLHQIRASFAHLGHPVAGDRVYGPAEAEDPTAAPRQMLHAARLHLDEIAAESPDPDDLVRVLSGLRQARSARSEP
jgi:23S rRNA pseudouridine1911/1915/1917 synthase